MKWVYPIILWVGSFVLMLWFALTQYNLGSDSAYYYNNYVLAIKNGWWSLEDNIPKASIVMTLLPATIQKILHTDILLTFKVYSSFILPFLPVVVYFLAKKFVNPFYAFMATVGILSTQSVFLRLPSYTQVGIATLFFALLILVMTSNIKWKYIWIALLSVVIVVSHYSIAYMTIVIISVTLGILWLLRKKRALFLVTFHALIVSAMIWTTLVVTMPYWTMIALIKMPSLEARAYAVEEYYGRNPLVADPKNFVNERTLAEVDMSTVRKRDPVIEQAFGKGLAESSLLSKVKWVVGWIGLLSLAVGSVLMTVKRKVPLEYIVLTGVCLVGMILWVAIPYISIAYGIGRVYFQASVILVVSLGILLQEIFNKGKYLGRQTKW